MSDGTSEPRSLSEKTDAFLREFFEKGESLVRDLIEENERLRVQISQAADEARPRAAVPSDLVDMLIKRVGVLERECDEIRRLAGTVEQSSGDYRDRLDALEAEHYHLACMFVAGSQYHGAATMDEILRTTTEVLLNFVGVGRFTLFVVDEARQVAFPVAREGGDRAAVNEMGLDDPNVAGAASLGRPWRGGDSMHETPGVLGWVPLVAGSRLVGMLRMESFLPQKKRFEDSDHGLIALVSERAGIGIETAWIRALAKRAKETPLQRDTIENLVRA